MNNEEKVHFDATYLKSLPSSPRMEYTRYLSSALSGPSTVADVASAEQHALTPSPSRPLSVTGWLSVPVMPVTAADVGGRSELCCSTKDVQKGESSTLPRPSTANSD